jgi:5-formyltetrahydrofolate cyclo-ligase
LRQPLRERLLAARNAFAAGNEASAAHRSLAQHLRAVITSLEPACLGLYWAVRSEFNASMVFAADTIGNTMPLALPFVRKSPPRMEYRAWDGDTPALLDETRIPSCDGVVVVPDVVLAPCVGFTGAGFRLGYGGGYFDRWLAAHPQVTSVGVAWAVGKIDDAEFEPQAHDVALTLMVTEHGVV